ncbi:tRNA 2-thiouridine(34) synthase MnmA [Patescibacteria group bacterium]|nr:tRNA 2-thiouridine(34) synthase MnmA [Patescibacteria group bacterium]
MSKKVALGMSGGVDSSLCAHLLKEQGYDVTGVFLECWRAPGCRTDQDRKDALKIALKLDIPFQVLDFKQTYHDKVVKYFFKEYQAGRTPNPDVMCNKEIKFGLFYDWAMKNNFDYVATGHYAKTQNGQLLTPKDVWKDQTYFLYLLTEKQLKHILFPLANLTKKEVRIEAKKRGIHVASKPDSVGICFIGDIDVRKFLKEGLGEKPGEVIDTQSNVIGTHNGIWFYTIGQRHGFTLKSSTSIKQSDGLMIERTNLPPFYVISKDAKKNQLVVGSNTVAYQGNFLLSELHLINQSEKLPTKLLVRIRHTGEMMPAQLRNKDKNYLIKLQKPARGIATGQSAVFYQKINDNNFQCLGGGIIY